MLRSEMCSLDESYVPFIALEVPFFMKPLLRPLPSLIFDLFVEDDEAETIEAKRKCEQEQQRVSDEEFRKAQRKATIESVTHINVDNDRCAQIALGTSSS